MKAWHSKWFIPCRQAVNKYLIEITNLIKYTGVVKSQD